MYSLKGLTDWGVTLSKSPLAKSSPSRTETAVFSGLTITPLGAFVKPEDSNLDVGLFAARKVKAKV